MVLVLPPEVGVRTAVAAAAVAQTGAAPKPAQQDPPQIFFSTRPAVLVNLDGDPIWSPIQGQVRREYELGSLRDALEDALSLQQRHVAHRIRFERSMVASGQAAAKLREAASRRQVEGCESPQSGAPAYGRCRAHGVLQYSRPPKCFSCRAPRSITREGLIQFDDVGDLVAVRYVNWKMVFMEQRCPGTVRVCRMKRGARCRLEIRVP